MGERSLDARTDVYAVGCVLYEMLTGEPPFTGPTAQSIVAKVMTAEPKSVSTYRKPVPAHVADAVTVALAKLPAERFPSAAEFATALGNAAFATTSGAQRAPSGSAVRGVSRAAVGALAALAAVLLVLAVIGWMRPQPAAEPSRQRVALWALQLPSGMSAGSPFGATQATIAPDGSSIVFVDSRRARLRFVVPEVAQRPVVGQVGLAAWAAVIHLAQVCGWIAGSPRGPGSSIRDRKFNRAGWSRGPAPLPRERRGAGFGATATAPVRLAGGAVQAATSRPSRPGRR